MEPLVHSQSWICRTCGLSNPIGAKSCQDCTSAPLFQSRNSILQVLGSGSGPVNGNVYSISAENIFISPREEVEEDPVEEDDMEEPSPAPDHMRRALMTGLTVITWLSVFIVGSIFAFFAIVVFVAFTRGH